MPDLCPYCSKTNELIVKYVWEESVRGQMVDGQVIVEEPEPSTYRERVVYCAHCSARRDDL